jgi:hypothetical protein
MSAATESYTEEEIAVDKLEIDRAVQREGLTSSVVAKIVKNYDEASIGFLTVSRRKNGALVIIDGQHRWRATQIHTDNMGTLWCRVFTGLTLSEESQMFLNLNNTTKPAYFDKFRVVQNTPSPEGARNQNIVELAHAFGYEVARTAGVNHINAVMSCVKLYDMSAKHEREPNLLLMTLKTISRAWGNNEPYNVQGPIIEGIGYMWDEYGDRLDLEVLVSVMQDYQGQARTLLAEAGQMAALQKGRKSMAVAHLLVEAYNKVKRGAKYKLHPWRRR